MEIIVAMVLREIRYVRQVPGEYHRKWWSDDFFDLYLWYDEARRLVGFQLCYDTDGWEFGEHAITFLPEKGISHRTVANHGKGTPTLHPNGAFPGGEIIPRFKEASTKMSVRTRLWILNHLEQLFARNGREVRW